MLLRGAIRRASQLVGAPTFSTAQHPVRLTDLLAGADELLRRGGVELEHVEMARDNDAGADFFGEVGSLHSIEVARNAAFRKIAINGQESDVNWPCLQLVLHFIKELGVA